MNKLANEAFPEQRASYNLADQLMSFSRQQELAASDTILKKLLEYGRSMLSLEVAFISEFLDQRRVFRYINAAEDFCPIQVGAGDPIDESYCIRVVDGRLPELIHNAQKNRDACQLTATAAVPVGAHVSVPIVLSDQSIYGTFCCFSRVPNYQISQRDVENFRFLAHCAALVIEKDVGGLRVFDQKRKQVQEAMDKALFFPVFQPVFDLASQQAEGFEALTRFVAKPRKTPQHWFEDARDVGLQEALELATLNAAMAALEHPMEKYIAVNFSPNSLLKQQQKILSALPSDQTIVIEITEHDVIEDYDLVNRALAPLRERGIKLAVDDVGAGYASLKHILMLKPDIIKIDQSIVKFIDRNPDAQAITRAMVAFAQEINCDVVAEGIETEEELATLKALNVARGQGFLLAVPNKDAIAKWL